MARNPRRRTSAKKKARRNVPRAQAHIQATYNNTIITFADMEGNVICWASAGSSGFKGSRKSTPYAAQLAGRNVARQARDFGVRELQIFVKGPGPGREASIRTLIGEGFTVVEITDVTPLPHNGCRPPKKRRV
jgi:small subunit ribosomal protein S11